MNKKNTTNGLNDKRILRRYRKDKKIRQDYEKRRNQNRIIGRKNRQIEAKNAWIRRQNIKRKEKNLSLLDEIKRKPEIPYPESKKYMPSSKKKVRKVKVKVVELQENIKPEIQIIKKPSIFVRIFKWIIAFIKYDRETNQDN